MNHKIDVRQRNIIRILASFLKRFPSLASIKPERYLDLGCGNGELTLKVSKIMGAKEVYGVDIDEESLLLATEKQIKTFKVDLNRDRLPFEDNTFDLVTSFDVIHYLVNTDNLISEAYRVLKPGGYFIITTFNLASWVNRLLLLLGYLPYFCEVSFSVDVEKRPFQNSSGVGGVIRAYTFKTLQRHLEYYGFDVIYSTSFSTLYVSKNLLMRAINRILSLRKTLGGNIAILARK